MRNLRSFIMEEDGMGTVEVVLILVVLIALVLLFKNAIASVVKNTLSTITTNAGTVANPIE